MPSLNGISISIVTTSNFSKHGFGIFPEFPHPECPQFTSQYWPRRPFKWKQEEPKSEPPDQTTPSRESKLSQRTDKEVNSSVYIPSAPDTRFWIRYRILAQAAECKYYFFKLVMNGREITSWGCKSGSQVDGQVTRALFDPELTEANCYSDEATGIIYKKMGLEKRAFLFMPEPERIDGQSFVAADGGLIEIQVYRSSHRVRKMQDPTIYKSQESYGISLKSAKHLLEDPHLAKYFEYLLVDPLDNPYSVFKFHYRSWDSLIDLNLVSEDSERRLLPLSPSIWNLFGRSQLLERYLAQDIFDKLEADERRIPGRVPLTHETLCSVPASESPREKQRGKFMGELRSNDSDAGNSYMSVDSTKFDGDHNDGQVKALLPYEEVIQAETASTGGHSGLDDHPSPEPSDEVAKDQDSDQEVEPKDISKSKKLASRPSTPYNTSQDAIEPDSAALDILPKPTFFTRARNFFSSNKQPPAKKSMYMQSVVDINPNGNTSDDVAMIPSIPQIDPFDETPPKRKPIGDSSPIRKLSTDDIPNLDPPNIIEESRHPDVAAWLNDPQLPNSFQNTNPNDSSPTPKPLSRNSNSTQQPLHEPLSIDSSPTPKPLSRNNNSQRPLPLLPERDASSKTLRRTATGIFRSAPLKAPDTSAHQDERDWSPAISHDIRNTETPARPRADSLTKTKTPQPTDNLRPNTNVERRDFSNQSSTYSIPIMIDIKSITPEIRQPITPPVSRFQSAGLDTKPTPTTPHPNSSTPKPTTIIPNPTTSPPKPTPQTEKALPSIPTSSPNTATEATTPKSYFSPDSQKGRRGLRGSLNVFMRRGKKEKEAGGG